MTLLPPPGALEDAPDEALVRATLGGDDGAFAKLVRRHLRKAMAVAMTYVGSREDAEDVVQEAFRRAFQNLRHFDPSKSFQPWFFTILRNAARNALEKRGSSRTEPLSVDHPATQPGPFEEVQRMELRQTIEQAVALLPPMQRACFQLCLVEGFSSAEAAGAVGIAESTVRVHVFKARQTLQGLLERWRLGQSEER